MRETPSTACCTSEFPDVSQQRVLLFGSVRCNDLESIQENSQNSSQLDQGFGHGRAQMYRQHYKQALDSGLFGLDLSCQKLSNLKLPNLELPNLKSGNQGNQRKNHQESNLDDLNNYFTSLGGGTSSQTSNGRRSAVFGEGLYDETI